MKNKKVRRLWDDKKGKGVFLLYILYML